MKVTSEIKLVNVSDVISPALSNVLYTCIFYKKLFSHINSFSLQWCM